MASSNMPALPAGGGRSISPGGQRGEIKSTSPFICNVSRNPRKMSASERKRAGVRFVRTKVGRVNHWPDHYYFHGKASREIGLNDKNSFLLDNHDGTLRRKKNLLGHEDGGRTMWKDDVDYTNFSDDDASTSNSDYSCTSQELLMKRRFKNIYEGPRHRDDWTKSIHKALPEDDKVYIYHRNKKRENADLFLGRDVTGHWGGKNFGLYDFLSLDERRIFLKEIDLRTFLWRDFNIFLPMPRGENGIRAMLGRIRKQLSKKLSGIMSGKRKKSKTEELQGDASLKPSNAEEEGHEFDPVADCDLTKIFHQDSDQLMILARDYLETGDERLYMNLKVLVNKMYEKRKRKLNRGLKFARPFDSVNGDIVGAVSDNDNGTTDVRKLKRGFSEWNRMPMVNISNADEIGPPRLRVGKRSVRKNNGAFDRNGLKITAELSSLQEKRRINKVKALRIRHERSLGTHMRIEGGLGKSGSKKTSQEIHSGGSKSSNLIASKLGNNSKLDTSIHSRNSKLGSIVGNKSAVSNGADDYLGSGLRTFSPLGRGRANEDDVNTSDAEDEIVTSANGESDMELDVPPVMMETTLRNGIPDKPCARDREISLDALQLLVCPRHYKRKKKPASVIDLGYLSYWNPHVPNSYSANMLEDKGPEKGFLRKDRLWFEKEALPLTIENVRDFVAQCNEVGTMEKVHIEKAISISSSDESNFGHTTFFDPDGTIRSLHDYHVGAPSEKKGGIIPKFLSSTKVDPELFAGVDSQKNKKSMRTRAGVDGARAGVPQPTRWKQLLDGPYFRVSPARLKEVETLSGGPHALTAQELKMRRAQGDLSPSSWERSAICNEDFRWDLPVQSKGARPLSRRDDSAFASNSKFDNSDFDNSNMESKKARKRDEQQSKKDKSTKTEMVGFEEFDEEYEIPVAEDSKSRILKDSRATRAVSGEEILQSSQFRPSAWASQATYGDTSLGDTQRSSRALEESRSMRESRKGASSQDFQATRSSLHTSQGLQGSESRDNHGLLGFQTGTGSEVGKKQVNSQLDVSLLEDGSILQEQMQNESGAEGAIAESAVEIEKSELEVSIGQSELESVIEGADGAEGPDDAERVDGERVDEVDSELQSDGEAFRSSGIPLSVAKHRGNYAGKKANVKAKAAKGGSVKVGKVPSSDKDGKAPLKAGQKEGQRASTGSKASSEAGKSAGDLVQESPDLLLQESPELPGIVQQESVDALDTTHEGTDFSVERLGFPVSEVSEYPGSPSESGAAKSSPKKAGMKAKVVKGKAKKIVSVKKTAISKESAEIRAAIPKESAELPKANAEIGAAQNDDEGKPTVKATVKKAAKKKAPKSGLKSKASVSKAHATSARSESAVGADPSGSPRSSPGATSRTNMGNPQEDGDGSSVAEIKAEPDLRSTVKKQSGVKKSGGKVVKKSGSREASPKMARKTASTQVSTDKAPELVVVSPKEFAPTVVKEAVSTPEVVKSPKSGVKKVPSKKGVSPKHVKSQGQKLASAKLVTTVETGPKTTGSKTVFGQSGLGNEAQRAAGSQPSRVWAKISAKQTLSESQKAMSESKKAASRVVKRASSSKEKKSPPKGASPKGNTVSKEEGGREVSSKEGDASKVVKKARGKANISFYNDADSWDIDGNTNSVSDAAISISFDQSDSGHDGSGAFSDDDSSEHNASQKSDVQTFTYPLDNDVDLDEDSSRYSSRPSTQKSSHWSINKSDSSARRADGRKKQCLCQRSPACTENSDHTFAEDADETWEVVDNNDDVVDVGDINANSDANNVEVEPTFAFYDDGYTLNSDGTSLNGLPTNLSVETGVAAPNGNDGVHSTTAIPRSRQSRENRMRLFFDPHHKKNSDGSVLSRTDPLHKKPVLYKSSELFKGMCGDRSWNGRGSYGRFDKRGRRVEPKGATWAQIRENNGSYFHFTDPVVRICKKGTKNITKKGTESIIIPGSMDRSCCDDRKTWRHSSQGAASHGRRTPGFTSLDEILSSMCEKENFGNHGINKVTNELGRRMSEVRELRKHQGWMGPKIGNSWEGLLSCGGRLATNWSPHEGDDDYESVYGHHVKATKNSKKVNDTTFEEAMPIMSKAEKAKLAIHNNESRQEGILPTGSRDEEKKIAFISRDYNYPRRSILKTVGCPNGDGTLSQPPVDESQQTERVALDRTFQRKSLVQRKESLMGNPATDSELLRLANIDESWRTLAKLEGSNSQSLKDLANSQSSKDLRGSQSLKDLGENEFAKALQARGKSQVLGNSQALEKSHALNPEMSRAMDAGKKSIGIGTKSGVLNPEDHKSQQRSRSLRPSTGTSLMNHSRSLKEGDLQTIKPSEPRKVDQSMKMDEKVERSMKMDDSVALQKVERSMEMDAPPRSIAFMQSMTPTQETAFMQSVAPAQNAAFMQSVTPLQSKRATPVGASPMRSIGTPPERSIGTSPMQKSALAMRSITPAMQSGTSAMQSRASAMRSITPGTGPIVGTNDGQSRPVATMGGATGGAIVEGRDAVDLASHGSPMYNREMMQTYMYSVYGTQPKAPSPSPFIYSPESREVSRKHQLSGRHAVPMKRDIHTNHINAKHDILNMKNAVYEENVFYL